MILNDRYGMDGYSSVEGRGGVGSFLFSVVLCLLFPVASWGQVFKFSSPMEWTQKWVVRGGRGSLKIQPGSQLDIWARREKSRGDSDWKVELQKKDRYVEIRVRGPSSAQDWEKIQNQIGLIPAFEMVLKLPQKPVEIFWPQGSVSVENWSAPMNVQVNKGRVYLSKGRGDSSIQILDGTLRVEDHRGPLNLQTYKGQVFLKKIEGSLRVQNQMSSYKVSQFQGTGIFKNHVGNLSLSDVQGAMNLSSFGGFIVIRHLSGDFLGKINETSLKLQPSPLGKVEVHSKRGQVVLGVPKNSGASLKIRSLKSRVKTPSYLRRLKKGSWIEWTGRFKGKEKGSIEIVSEYGEVNISQSLNSSLSAKELESGRERSN